MMNFGMPICYYNNITSQGGPVGPRRPGPARPGAPASPARPGIAPSSTASGVQAASPPRPTSTPATRQPLANQQPARPGAATQSQAQPSVVTQAPTQQPNTTSNQRSVGDFRLDFNGFLGANFQEKQTQESNTPDAISQNTERPISKIAVSAEPVVAPAGNTKSINPKSITESLPYDGPGARSGAGVSGRPGQQAANTGGDDDAPIVRYLQKALTTAIDLGVSDLHFEPFENGMRLRYRLDGILKIVATNIPIDAREKLVTRIKVLSKLDIAEKRIPQDGRLKLNVSTTKAIDFRVSTLPTIWGEKVVMRILNSDVEMLDLNLLGYEPEQLRLLLDAINKPYGMILVTGPTGSGKTVSLYSCLSILNDGERNISTAEDPCEIQVVGINQVSINEKAGLTFASAMRSFLRQDPDIIMVGEIRDLETADIAVKASQTGHLVFSTLHTNDAPSTLVRLLNMGVPAFNIASSVNLITAQRLVRRLCPKCKTPHVYRRQELIDAGVKEKDLNETWMTYTTVGCEACEGTGYKGRLGVYQVMPITPEMEKLILTNGTAPEIAALAERQGVLDLRQAGLLKVRHGLTTLEEVVANTKIN